MDYSDKFENINEVFTLTSAQLKEKGIPAMNRRYLLRVRELMRRGLLTFEYLARRTKTEKIREK